MKKRNFIGPKSIVKKFNDAVLERYGLRKVSKCIDLTKEIEELKGLELLDTGATTIVFKKNEEKVICLTQDYLKVLYLKSIKSEIGFKFIRFEKCSETAKTEYFMIYEMDLMKGMTWNNTPDDKYDFLDFLKAKSDIYRTFPKSFKTRFEKHDVLFNQDFLKSIKKKKHVSSFEYDFHDEQFMFNKDKRIVCVDPFMPNNFFDFY